MLVIAPQELGDRADAYLNASPENFASSGTFLAPPPRQSPKVRVALRSFTGSAPIDSVASGRGWLAQKRSACQDARPARRPVSSCRRRAGLLANRGVAPGNLAGAVETRTPQVIEAPALFGGPCGEFFTMPLQTGLRPVEAPFHETSVTGLRPVGQDCSAATPGPAANACLSSDALDSPREDRPRSYALHGDELAVGTRLRLGAGHLVFTARACRRCPRGRWLRGTRSAGQNHRPARRTVPSCTRRAGLLASGTRPALPRHFPRCPDLSRWTTPSHGATITSPTHRGTRMGEHITSSSVERARRDWPPGAVLSLCSRTSKDALATSQQGLAPDPRCARAGEARVVGPASIQPPHIARRGEILSGKYPQGPANIIGHTCTYTHRQDGWAHGHRDRAGIAVVTDRAP
jgi:hypothetical protein